MNNPAPMKTTVYTHKDAFEHKVPQQHAEQPERLHAVLDGLHDKALTFKSAPLAAREDLLRVHTSSYLDRLLAMEVGSDEIVALDADTFLSKGSITAALRGAGSACLAVDDVLTQKTEAAFCAMRPPGHHARPDAAMGFCIFSNIAIAARRALDEHGLQRIAVIDFDVHHGNGTQEALWDIPGCLFVSLHQQDHYPGTGHANETGGIGEVLNLPMAAGTSASQWMQVFTEQALVRVAAHRPELILVSAGFDAHHNDPLGGFNLQADDFGYLGSLLGNMARKHTNSQLVSVLEGGYQLPALCLSSSNFVDGLLQS